MPSRFRKSFGSSRGFRTTISKSGISTSFGVPGFRITKGKRGTNVTVGIPGSGYYHTEKLPEGEPSPEVDARIKAESGISAWIALIPIAIVAIIIILVQLF